MVNISWEKGEGADMGTLGTLKEKMELPLRAPKPAPGTELPLKDRKQMQGCPEAGALSTGSTTLGAFGGPGRSHGVDFVPLPN